MNEEKKCQKQQKLLGFPGMPHMHLRKKFWMNTEQGRGEILVKLILQERLAVHMMRLQRQQLSVEKTPNVSVQRHVK